jgi:beta-glucosidase-like glycosyl hydrolase
MSETRREEHGVPNRDAKVTVTGASADEAHIDSLLDQLTLEEKASLTGGHDLWHLPPIARLGIGRLTMSDGPSGVRGARFIDRSLSLPCGSALGATWNPDLIEQVGEVLAAEAVTKGCTYFSAPPYVSRALLWPVGPSSRTPRTHFSPVVSPLPMYGACSDTESGVVSSTLPATTRSSSG